MDYTILYVIFVFTIIAFAFCASYILSKMYRTIGTMNKTIDDISIYLRIIEKNNNLMEAMDEKVNLCNHTNLEVVSKLKATNKVVDNSFQTINTKLFNALSTLSNIEAKISYMSSKVDDYRLI